MTTQAEILAHPQEAAGRARDGRPVHHPRPGPGGGASATGSTSCTPGRIVESAPAATVFGAPAAPLHGRPAGVDAGPLRGTSPTRAHQGRPAQPAREAERLLRSRRDAPTRSRACATPRCRRWSTAATERRTRGPVPEVRGARSAAGRRSATRDGSADDGTGTARGLGPAQGLPGGRHQRPGRRRTVVHARPRGLRRARG